MRTAASLFFSVCALLALAQQDNASKSQENPFFLKQEITVTATRTEIEPSKAPVSASTVPAGEIGVRNLQTVDRALDSLPGVYLSRGKGFQDTLAGVGMRGFSGRGSLQSRTLVLLDGQPLNEPYTGSVSWTTLPVDEVERVEVVRGPFSALYGNNAMGGVIQILTRPVDRRRVDLRGDYGSQDTFRYGARLADRFFQRLGVSLSYDRLQSGGYPSQLVTSAGTTGTGGTPVTGFIPSLTSTGSPTFILGDTGNNCWEQTAWRFRADYTFSERTALTFQYLRQRSYYGYDAYHSYLRTVDGRPFDSGVASLVTDGVPRRISLTPSMFLSGDGGTLSRLASARIYRALGSGARIRVGAGFIDTPMSYYST
ncbi:MAG: TonB-dependent receptor, partial [Bryobacteraceae bacterium]